MTAIQVRGLRKSYTDTLAVDGIDLDIPAGQVFALLGPNGAGKTTTVEILEGHRTRTAGEVSVLGADPATAGRAWRARIGIVLQSADDAASLTVRESVRHYAGFYPRPAHPTPPPPWRGAGAAATTPASPRARPTRTPSSNRSGSPPRPAPASSSSP